MEALFGKIAKLCNVDPEFKLAARHLNLNFSLESVSHTHSSSLSPAALLPTPARPSAAAGYPTPHHISISRVDVERLACAGRVDEEAFDFEIRDGVFERTRFPGSRRWIRLEKVHASPHHITILTRGGGGGG